MENLVPDIRNAVRAVIMREGKVLLLKKTDGDQGERYALPGGAQDLGETLHDALIRECLEEIGTRVRVLELLHVADFFKVRDTDPPSTRHLVEFLFRCEVPDDYIAHNGFKPDKRQVGVAWVGLDELEGMALFPKSLCTLLPMAPRPGAAVYLGILE